MVEMNKITIRQDGTTIQIFPEVNGDYLTLDDAAAEVLKRDKNYVIEKVEIFLLGELLEVPNCLVQLRAKVENAIIFSESSIVAFNKTLSDQKLEKMWQHRDSEIRKSTLLENENNLFLSLKVNSNLKISDVIKPICGQIIGINALDVSKIEPAKLIEIQYDYFAVEVGDVLVHVPYSQIIKVTSSKTGNLSIGAFGFGGNFALIIKVFHFVIYKGAVGVGLQIPI